MNPIKTNLSLSEFEKGIIPIRIKFLNNQTSTTCFSREILGDKEMISNLEEAILIKNFPSILDYLIDLSKIDNKNIDEKKLMTYFKDYNLFRLSNNEVICSQITKTLELKMPPSIEMIFSNKPNYALWKKIHPDLKNLNLIALLWPKKDYLQIQLLKIVIKDNVDVFMSIFNEASQISYNDSATKKEIKEFLEKLKENTLKGNIHPTRGEIEMNILPYLIKKNHKILDLVDKKIFDNQGDFYKEIEILLNTKKKLKLFNYFNKKQLNKEDDYRNILAQFFSSKPEVYSKLLNIPLFRELTFINYKKIKNFNFRFLSRLNEKQVKTLIKLDKDELSDLDEKTQGEYKKFIFYIVRLAPDLYDQLTAPMLADALLENYIQQSSLLFKSNILVRDILLHSLDRTMNEQCLIFSNLMLNNGALTCINALKSVVEEFKIDLKREDFIKWKNENPLFYRYAFADMRRRQRNNDENVRIDKEQQQLQELKESKKTEKEKQQFNLAALYFALQQGDCLSDFAFPLQADMEGDANVYIYEQLDPILKINLGFHSIILKKAPQLWLNIATEMKTPQLAIDFIKNTTKDKYLNDVFFGRDAKFIESKNPLFIQRLLIELFESKKNAGDLLLICYKILITNIFDCRKEAQNKERERNPYWEGSAAPLASAVEYFMEQNKIDKLDKNNFSLIDETLGDSLVKIKNLLNMMLNSFVSDTKFGKLDEEYNPNYCKHINREATHQDLACIFYNLINCPLVQAYDYDFASNPKLEIIYGKHRDNLCRAGIIFKSKFEQLEEWKDIKEVKRIYNYHIRKDIRKLKCIPTEFTKSFINKNGFNFITDTKIYNDPFKTRESLRLLLLIKKVEGLIKALPKNILFKIFYHSLL